MSFPRYEKYKDSGVEWLGDVPAHWDIGQSRRLFAQRKDRALEADQQLTASQKHGVIYQRDFMELEGQKVVQVIHGADILKHVEPNDFVISMRSFQGGIEWCGLRGCISSAYVMLMPCDKVDPGYFRYLLKSKTYIQALQSTSNLVRDGQALRYENFTLVDLPLVPVEEQQAIAIFLDHETAKIDALVEEQKRLIELLKEKRQAVISQAVTKGLDPSVPMKDSGVAWLGEVPAHWDVARLRYLSDIGTGDFDTADAVQEGEFPFFVRSETVERLDRYTHDCEAVFTSGDGAGVGKIFHYFSGRFSAHQRVYVFKSFRRVSGVFFHLFLAANFFKVALEGGAKSTVDSLRRPLIANFWMTVPPPKEQAQAVDAAERLSIEYGELISAAEKAVHLLLERRSALISAAVTGKIDVRGLAPQPEVIAA